MELTRGDEDDGERGRISRLTRTLARVESLDTFLVSATAIHHNLKQPENRKYIQKSFAPLAVTLADTFKGLASGIGWREKGVETFATLLLGMADAMEGQSNRLYLWLIDLVIKKGKRGLSSNAYTVHDVFIQFHTRFAISHFPKTDDYYRITYNHVPISHTVNIMFRAKDADIYLVDLVQMVGRIDEDEATVVISALHKAIEEVDHSDGFKILSAIFVACLDRKGDWSSPHFHDFVDVVIGWMVDETLKDDHSDFCTDLILLLKPHFVQEISFSKTLINQILEDMEAATKGLAHSSSAVYRVLLLAKAYIAMLRIECVTDKTFVNESTERMVSNALQVLNGIRPTANDRTLEWMYSLMGIVSLALSFSFGVDGPFTRTFVKTELECLKNNEEWKKWPKIVLGEMIEGIGVWIESLVSVTQLSDEVMEICEELMVFVDKIVDQKDAIHLIHALFRTRNVQLLQKVYQWHILKLEIGPSTRQQTLFILAGLSDIAVNRSGSILSLWALQPPIFQFLMDLRRRETDPRVQFSILNLLRCHCTIHSHFVSSFATTGSFSSESPGARFLPSLMDFWIEELRRDSLTSSSRKWMWEWVLEFFQSSSSYAALLVQSKAEFYEQLVQIVISEIIPTSDKLGIQLVQFLCEDTNYAPLDRIQIIIEEASLKVLYNPSSKTDLKLSFQRILKRLETLIVSEKPLREGNCLNVNEKSLTPTEFSAFVHELLSSGERRNAEELVDSAVNHLIRSKLRTPLGKPQEFFGQLHSILRKRSVKDGFPVWKLRFVFELERGFTLWIHGSSVREVDFPEQIKTFYLTNKSTCMELLKRMRADLIETSLATKIYTMAVFNASLSADTQKLSTALFELQDLEGLKGLGELAAYYYLQGSFEKALELLKNDPDDNGSKNSLKHLVQKRAATLLSSSTDLESWSSQGTFGEDLKSPSSFLSFSGHPSSLLNIQLENEEKKTHLKVTDASQSDLSIWTLIRVLDWVKWNTNANISETQVEELEILRGKKMLEFGNFVFSRQWLIKKGIDWNDVEMRKDLSFPFVRSHKIYLEMAAELCVCNDQVDSAAWIYQQLLRHESEENQHSHSQLIVKIASKMQKFPALYEPDNVKTLGLFGETFDFEDPQKSLGSLLEKALHVCPSEKMAWYSYGQFNYQQSTSTEGDEAISFKSSAVECYTNFLRLSYIDEDELKVPNGESKRMVTIVMSRLLKLFREGYEFEPQEVISSDLWLDFLPEIAQIPLLRPFFVRRFPQESSLYFASYDSSQLSWKPPLKKKGLFDPSSFILTEVSDEAFSPTSTGIVGVCDCSSKRGRTPYLIRSELNISEEVKMLGKELLRVGTSAEELWSWSLQRILIDWNKRLNSLKKDLARDPDPLKVRAYIQPVVRFLEGLWEESQNAESPAELAFVGRNQDILPNLLRNISNSTTVDAVVASFDKLLFHAETFDAYISYKSPLHHLSPRLAKFHASKEEGMLYLPGVPISVSIVSVEPIVYALATKTKPKKIRFRGSNGKCFEYLVKGNENLNVDSGVMQFLKLSSQFLDTPTRTYTVTPLGKRGGLIQMVEGAIPIFVLYKKFLQRNNNVERTSEMFWRRMNALGCSDRSNLTALKEVFQSLEKEAPSELISREILLCARDVSRWYEGVKTFTMDCGVSSAIGYVLGIGDRHLDNILVDLHEGKLIHVDFSVLFGKGMTLRVPECVPFRLTQNFSSAVQHPGPEGAFSVYMEQALEKFQRNQELAMFCAKSIAFSSQLDEDSPVAPYILLLAEINSALSILRFRYRNIWKTTHLIKNEILECSAELENGEANLQECKLKMKLCEDNIDNLTVALSVLKENQADLTKLTALRARCNSKSSRLTGEDGCTDSSEKLLEFYTENFVKKNLVTENDVQWANSIDKIISSQLQAEVQQKFALADEHGRLTRAEVAASSRLNKRISRWRRVLANLDPLLCFIYSNVSEDGITAEFKSIVETQWIPEVAHFWLHSGLNELVAKRGFFSYKFDFAEATMDKIFALDLMLSEAQIGTSNLFVEDQAVDSLELSRMDSILKSVQQKITGFNSSTSVERLIRDATQVDNLAQMYEGWTPWV